MHGDSPGLSRCLKCNDQNPTIHVTLKTSSGFVSIDLCEKCRPSAVILEVPASTRQVRCPSCGISLQEVSVKGRLGCADDYLIFSSQIVQGLEQYHGSVQHVGKIPKSKR